MIARGLLLIAALSPASAGAQDKITLPAGEWNGMLAEIEAAARPETPPVAVTPIDRRIDGTFRKGLFEANLRARFAVLAEHGHVRVPVLDSGASLGEVLVNGRRTSLLRDGRMYSLGVEGKGTYELRVRFYWGQEKDRFTRRLAFDLPGAGATEVSVLVPERDIEARLENGSLEVAPVGTSTRLVGHIDASGRFDLSWTRKLSHQAGAAVRSELEQNTIFTAGEALITGVATFEVEVLEGETDRIDLELPENLEVLRVEGDAVLQWHTDAEGGGRLTALLRYLVDDRTTFAVHFQFPVGAADQPIPLVLPLSPEGTVMRGNLGVQAPAGLNVKVAASAQATELTARDFPPELTDRTSRPLLVGFSFTEKPEVSIAVERHQEVQLTSTIVDELQASTVLIEDGTEITKLKLRVRNNTRQYLTLSMPADSLLTHSLIDGNPVRPALGDEGALMFPLRQSERIGKGEQRIHTVQAGETLSELANFYYSQPAQWRRIIEANPSLYGPEDLWPGQQLVIPASGGTVEESTFVIELAYKRQRDPLGNLGHRAVVLPELDVDTVRVTWHLYVPQALEALAFTGNLTQYSSIRYDPFRRLHQFLGRAMWVSDAWAGGKYRSILSQRKAIWKAETQQRTGGQVALASFPLVGERFRFKRILLGGEQATLAVSYVDATVIPVARWLALIAAFVLGLLFLRAPRERRNWAIAGVGLLVLLVLAHFVLGVHRRILWGVDLALLVTLGRLQLRPLLARVSARLKEPWVVGNLIAFRNLAFLVGVSFALWVLTAYPLLLSSFAAVILSVLTWRAFRKEVARA